MQEGVFWGLHSVVKVCRSLGAWRSWALNTPIYCRMQVRSKYGVRAAAVALYPRIGASKGCQETSKGVREATPGGGRCVGAILSIITILCMKCVCVYA